MTLSISTCRIRLLNGSVMMALFSRI